MKQFYIYLEEMDGSAYPVATITAETKAEALSAYFNENGISMSAEWLYHAADKKKVDKSRELLRLSGHSSWGEYYADRYPERPIEL